MARDYDLIVVGSGVAGLYGALVAAGDRSSGASVLVEEAPARIRDLIDLGVPFDDELGLEGGHSRRRVHSVGGAQTGREISKVLARAVLAHPRIDVEEGERAIELVHADGRVVGVV